MIEQKKGCIFNIQHYSLHDGEGIRTTVFLKGCPLRCRWCCNPESQNYNLEHMGNAVVGSFMTVEEVLEEVEQDEIFYKEDGGMTISGGEPFLQFDFLLALLKEAKKRYLSVTMETCGMTDTENFLEAVKYLDFLYFDIKCLDSKKHKEWTGVENQQILTNLKELKKTYPDLPVCVRTPIIPEFNDTKKDVQEICKWLCENGVGRYELLPYHNFGKEKYHKLGREYPMGDAKLEAGKIEKLRKVVEQYGLEI